ncbi:MAG: fasciclin domain-containing protein [Ferruginibacter sp.]|nr:fasciclin domain-containing protein [Ferruginibacter sp.]
MNKIIQRFLILLTLTVLLVNCRKKAYDEYYGRPDTLEPPIYQQLAAKGNFVNLLAAIDKAGYKSTLGAAGYWTFFAPHDSAFQVYFKEKNITGIDQVDSSTCRAIVTYCLVYNAFKKERIGDYQSSIGWVPASAFRRRTAYSVGVYSSVDTSGKPIKVISSNRNNNGAIYYVEADNNNKCLPYFVDNFMTSKGLNAADYNYFFPGTSYTGFNVADAIVTERDIPAENGVIHVINKVITALPSIDEYITTKPEYSLFKSIFDKYLIQYILNPGVTTRYQNIKGGSDQVFTKVYNQNLAYSLNNENFLKQQDNDAQSNSYSIFVPDNTTLQNYINTVLLENYTSLDQMPRQIIYDFINAHLWQNVVWPSKFNTTFSFVNEEARFNPATDIADKKILSNGIFYGTKKVQDANVFSSVYGRAYLDPKYSMMITMLNLELKFQVSNIYNNYTLFMISDSMFNAMGYTKDVTISTNVNDQWRFTPPPGSPVAASTGQTTRNRLQRIINMHVVPRVVLNSLAGEGVVMSYGGEYIGYKNNTVFAAGNVDTSGLDISTKVANITGTKTAKNGRVYYMNRLMPFSEYVVGKHIENIGTPVTSPYNSFWQYLRNSALWNSATKEITGVASGTFYTLFIPDKAAIQKAVVDGVLPGTGVGAARVPNFNPSLPAEKELVNKFILYHFLNKRTVGADGVESGAFETIFKKVNGDPTTIFVNNTPGLLSLTDMNSRSATVISSPSYYLSNRCVIHLVNNYLKYIE